MVPQSEAAGSVLEVILASMPFQSYSKVWQLRSSLLVFQHQKTWPIVRAVFCGNKTWGVKQQSFDAARAKLFRVPPIAGVHHLWNTWGQLDRQLRHCLNHGREPKAGTEWRELQLKLAKRQPRGSQALLIVSQLFLCNPVISDWPDIREHCSFQIVLSCSLSLSLKFIRNSRASQHVTILFTLLKGLLCKVLLEAFGEAMNTGCQHARIPRGSVLLISRVNGPSGSF